MIKKSIKLGAIRQIEPEIYMYAEQICSEALPLHVLVHRHLKEEDQHLYKGDNATRFGHGGVHVRCVDAHSTTPESPVSESAVLGQPNSHKMHQAQFSGGGNKDFHELEKFAWEACARASFVSVLGVAGGNLQLA